MNAHSQSIDVHCGMHGAECALSRTYTPYDGDGRLTPLRASRGRPAAFLIGWLRAGVHCTPGEVGRAEHEAIKKCKGDYAYLADGTSAQRIAARNWVERNPRMEPVCRAERRPRGDGEPIEPPGPF